ncbi:MAG TPA: DUF5678 domain-containing protein [Blastocatellia bacterium]|nr:DUF5678 domain-containing protein [Blastocatellia bacterium]
MSQTAEIILAEIAALPADERAKLVSLLNRKVDKGSDPRDGVSGEWFDSPDPEPSLRWIGEHREEFAGQYVALDGDRLIAHSPNPDEVIAVIRSAGLNGVFFTLIPPVDEPIFAGF